jgi:uncharacterized membrane protein
MVAQPRGERTTMTDSGFRSQRERDAREMEAIRQQRLVNLKAIGFTLAIVMAPFFALLYSMNLALAVLALALGFTTWLTWHATTMVGQGHGSQLKVAAGLNAMMMLATIAILVLRLTS